MRRAGRWALWSSLLLLAACSGNRQDAGEALARKQGCFNCHGLVNKQVGPGFAQVAERYRGDAAAVDSLATHIANGSVGRWGRVIMPRQSQLSAEDARALASWVLTVPASAIESAR